MGVIGIAVIVVAITLVVLAAFMIPAIIQVRKTASTVQEFITSVDIELKPVLKEMHETLGELRHITEEASTRTEDVKSFMEELGNAGRNLRTINNVVGTVAGVLGGSTLWVTGVKVAGKYLIERISRKRG